MQTQNDNTRRLPSADATVEETTRLFFSAAEAPTLRSNDTEEEDAPLASLSALLGGEGSSEEDRAECAALFASRFDFGLVAAADEEATAEVRLLDNDTDDGDLPSLASLLAG